MQYTCSYGKVPEAVIVLGSDGQPASLGGGGGAATVADGADVVAGALADAAATAGGTGTISAKLRAISTLISALAVEDAAQASGATGFAVMGQRQDSRASTVSADGDVAAIPIDASNRLKVVLSGGSVDWSVAGTLTNGSATTIKASAGTGIRNRIKSIQISHTTLGAATVLAVRDGSGGTVLWNCALDTTLSQGATFTLDPPIVGSNATLMEVILLTNPTSGSVYFNAQGDSQTS